MPFLSTYIDAGTVNFFPTAESRYWSIQISLAPAVCKELLINDFVMNVPGVVVVCKVVRNPNFLLVQQTTNPNTPKLMNPETFRNPEKSRVASKE